MFIFMISVVSLFLKAKGSPLTAVSIWELRREMAAFGVGKRAELVVEICIMMWV